MTTKHIQLPFGPEKLVPFTEELFDREEEEKAARVLFSILESRSPRKSDWSQVFNEEVPKKGPTTAPSIRVLPKLDAKKALMRLYDLESPFSSWSRSHRDRTQEAGQKHRFMWAVFRMARRSGVLLDGRLRPTLQGQRDPLPLRDLYSERTLNEALTSPNLRWRELICEVKDLVGETPLVFEREFSAQAWL